MLVCLLTLQKQCKAASNVIEGLPNTISIFWRTQLQEVDFSDNRLQELPSYIFELEVGAISWICLSAILTFVHLSELTKTLQVRGS